MAIRIGSSCALNINMAIGKVVETRRFPEALTQWYEIAKKCITEKIFLILTLCIDRNGKLEYIPSEAQWRNFVEDSTKKLISLGANWNNTRIDIINEPCKYIDKTTYVYLVNMAHNQINERLPVGAGCEEFVTAQAKEDMYPHLLRYGNFETLVIHIQGSCLNEDACSRWTNLALNWAISHKKKLDCNEANYFSINTDSGYKGLLMNLKYAEKIGCKNFPVVFINLDKSAFAVNTDRWERLAFFVNGRLHSSYWNDFSKLIEAKCPIPNIPIMEEDDMKLEKYYKLGSKGIGVKFIQMILNEDIKPEPKLILDGIWGSKTAGIVKQYQEKYELKVDGIVGPQTMKSMIEQYPWIWNEIEYEWAIGVR